MTAFFASICTAGVVAGILTAAAATNVERIPAASRQDVPATIWAKTTTVDINRAGKTDRLAPPSATIVVRTLSIRPQEALREVTACEPLVSPLADRVASRRARQCAT
jgi:hypothetical protein